MPATVELTDETELPEGVSRATVESVFEKIDDLDDALALAVALFVPDFSDVEVPGPHEVATIQDALKYVALRDPEAVAAAAIGALFALISVDVQADGDRYLSDLFG